MSQPVPTIDENPPPIPEGPLKNIIEALIAYKTPIVNGTTSTQVPNRIDAITNNFSEDVKIIIHAFMTRTPPQYVSKELQTLINTIFANTDRNDLTMNTLVPHYCKLILIEYSTALDPNQVERMVKAANGK